MTAHLPADLQMLLLLCPLGAVLLAGTGTFLVGGFLAFVTFWLVAHGAHMDDLYFEACLMASVVGGLCAMRPWVGRGTARRDRDRPDRDRPDRSVPARTRPLGGAPRSWGEVPPAQVTDLPSRTERGVVVSLRPRREFAGGRSAGDVA